MTGNTHALLGQPKFSGSLVAGTNGLIVGFLAAPPTGSLTPVTIAGATIANLSYNGGSGSTAFATSGITFVAGSFWSITVNGVTVLFSSASSFSGSNTWIFAGNVFGLVTATTYPVVIN